MYCYFMKNILWVYMHNWTYGIGWGKADGLISDHWERRKIWTKINRDSLKFQNYKFLIYWVSEYNSGQNIQSRLYVCPDPSSKWRQQMTQCRSFESLAITLFIWESTLVPPNFHSAGNLWGVSAHRWVLPREIWRRIRLPSTRRAGRGTANIL